MNAYVSPRPANKSRRCLNRALVAVWFVATSGLQAALPGGSLDPTNVTKYVTPLVIPPAMPPVATGAVAQYEIAARQFQQQILPTNYPKSTVWGYGSRSNAATFNYPSFTIEAKVGTPVRVKWANELMDTNRNYLPHLFAVDPTLHWANPPGPRDAHGVFSNTPGRYTGPVPIVTHLHGGHVTPEADGYPEAWWLPAASNLPAGYFEQGTWYKQSDTNNTEPGTAVFQYANDQRAATVWFHDHALGLTRLNVYAGLEGFYLLRGGADTNIEAQLPGPAPKVGDAPGTKYYELPLAIQDRSFNADGSLFFPTNRAFFDNFAGPYVPASDIAPLYNPEFFGNMMVVNGNTWPVQNVEPRRYRLRLLNGCNARTVVLKLVSDPLAIRPAAPLLPFWQIGNDGGFLPAATNLMQLRMASGERADVIVDFTGLATNTAVYLINEGPDSPYGGGAAGVDYPAADPFSTGQIMKFQIVPLTGADPSTPPNLLALSPIPALGAPVRTRQLSLNELDSMTLTNPVVGPSMTLLGTVTTNVLGRPIGVPMMWSDPLTETAAWHDTEIWEVCNFTVDGHPVHLHQVEFEVINHQVISNGVVRPPEAWEAGRKDTVVALPGEILRLKATFDIWGRYVWHCHIIDHEDNEMMRPYEIMVSSNLDFDADGLSDGAEVNTYHTDPRYADTDGDGLSDPAELNTYHTDPCRADTDNDGLSDGQELLVWHTDPFNPDTDGDGTLDGYEVTHGMNPLLPDVPGQTTKWVVVAWNNLGMHCMDSDFSLSSILPPYNTIHAQLLFATNGWARRFTNTTVTVVNYRATGDPNGSMNCSSVGKGNFWEYCPALFGLPLGADQGLPVPAHSIGMPGPANTPQPMDAEPASAWFAGYGIPITPYDDTQRKNCYPMMKLTATVRSQFVATNSIVLPVSDEMDCRSCHGSGGDPDAAPSAGWAWEPDLDRDFRMNLLARHDDYCAGSGVFAAALATNGYSSAGLYATAVLGHTPILCARCHRSEALPGSGFPGIPPLTQSVHGRHATVINDATGLPLNDSRDRQACYVCHPGSSTRCLRGAMGKAVAADGTMAMQCQNCHGSMSEVGSTSRTGWLNEPACQQCHAGVATNATGQIRFTSVYSAPGVPRVPADRTFATSSNTPAAGCDLFRFSQGHGGLYCEACHGSTHAEFPSSHPSDNLYSQALQGHEGVLSECTTCHGVSPVTTNGGPHGLHPFGSTWISRHRSPAKADRRPCQACHGADYTGTVLSAAHGSRSLVANSLTRNVWRGYKIGCYTCHPGPTNTDVAKNTNRPPVAVSASVATQVATPVTLGLGVSDTNGQSLAVRIVSQPANGLVALSGTNATYTPFDGFTGTDTFTFAAWDGQLESNLETGTVAVAGGTAAVVLTPTAFAFDERGGIGTVTITIDSNSDWLATPDYHWLSLVSDRAGTGTGIVEFAVEPQAQSGSRTGTLTVAGQAITVSQSGRPPDANGDGLPDAWQQLYFGSVASPDATPDDDPDDDGVANRQEYLLGTSPIDSNSFVRITSITVSTDTVSHVVFTTVSNRLFQAQSCGNLRRGDWRGFTPPLSGLGVPMETADSVPTNASQRFYRIRPYP